MFFKTFLIFLLFNFISGNVLKLSGSSLPPVFMLSTSETDLKLKGPIGEFIEQLARDLNLKILLTANDDSDISINRGENGNILCLFKKITKLKSYFLLKTSTKPHLKYSMDKNIASFMVIQKNIQLTFKC